LRYFCCAAPSEIHATNSEGIPAKRFQRRFSSRAIDKQQRFVFYDFADGD
jgi:hypothetical protein